MFVLGVQSTRSDAQPTLKLPDGGTVMTQIFHRTVSFERRSADGEIVWRLLLSHRPKIQPRIEGEMIILDDHDVILRDNVWQQKRPINEAPFVVYWPPAFHLTPALSSLASTGFQRVTSSGKGRKITVWRKGEWYYVGVSGPSNADRPSLLVRTQNQALLGKSTPTPIIFTRGRVTYVFAGAGDVYDDGTFTIARLAPEWLVQMDLERQAHQAGTDLGRTAPDLPLSQWLLTKNQRLCECSAVT
jgi:hypothetical protein